MIKIKEKKRIAHIIYGDLINRLEELIIRAEERNVNDTYLLAFQIGLQADIEDSLKKVRIPGGKRK